MSKLTYYCFFVPVLEARSAHIPMKSKQPLSNPRQNIHVGHKDQKSVPMNGQMHPNNKSASSCKPNLSMMKAKKQLGNSNHGNGPGRPVGNSNHGNGPGRPVGNSNNGNGPGRPMGNSNNGNGSGRPQGYSNNRNGPGRPQGYSNHGNGIGRPQGNSNNGSGPGRPMVAPKASSSHVQKKPSLPGMKSSVPGVHKPLPSKKLEDKRNEMRLPAKAKVAPNRPASSRPQVIYPHAKLTFNCVEKISFACAGCTTLNHLCDETNR